MHLPVVYPRPLKNDANVVVISPSSPQREDAFLQAGIDWFRQRGYQVTEGSSLWHRHGYLAGADTERLEELNSALQDPTVDLIVAGRGGYGAGRILEGIDYEAARRATRRGCGRGYPGRRRC